MPLFLFHLLLSLFLFSFAVPSVDRNDVRVLLFLVCLRFMFLLLLLLLLFVLPLSPRRPLGFVIIPKEAAPFGHCPFAAWLPYCPPARRFAYPVALQ